MNLSRFDLAFTCPCCGHPWKREDSKVIMDDECPRCGTVSKPTDYVERKG